MKRILFLSLTVIALVFSLSVTAFASEPEIEKDAAETAEAQEEEANGREDIYELVMENTDKLFSALAFISSLLLALSYKRSLIPVINTGLGAIKKSADAFGSTAESSLLKSEEGIERITDKLISCINTLEALSTETESLSERLSSIESSTETRASLKTVMLAQIDMLSEIFMNSSMPQYSKDAIGERISEMKKSLAEGEENV